MLGAGFCPVVKRRPTNALHVAMQAFIQCEQQFGIVPIFKQSGQVVMPFAYFLIVVEGAVFALSPARGATNIIMLLSQPLPSGIVGGA